MNPMQKEPAVTIGAGVAAVMGLLVYYGVLDLEGAGLWTTFLVVVAVPLAQALLTRMGVFSPNTIREAGLDPAAVKERAADPTVPRCDR
jgi:Mg/Co/Ni transporter MgtE